MLIFFAFVLKKKFSLELLQENGYAWYLISVFSSANETPS
jgi:hypothetical protein